MADPPVTQRGRALIESVIDPEIRRFIEWFSHPEHGNSGLTPMEKELFRSYLYFKLVEDQDG